MIEIVTSLRSKLDISFEIAVCVCVTGFVAVLIEIVTGFVCCKFQMDRFSAIEREKKKIQLWPRLYVAIAAF